MNEEQTIPKEIPVITTNLKTEPMVNYNNLTFLFYIYTLFSLLGADVFLAEFFIAISR